MKKIIQPMLNKFEMLYCFINKLFPERGRVLMFHHVTDERVDAIPCCICSVERFENLIINIRQKYRIIDIACLFEKHNDIIMVITFDDIFMDAFINAYPILKKYNIPFTVFISNDLIGKPGYIGIEELKQLNEDPLVTIGYHTQSHKKLINVANLKYEICDSCSHLENFLGKPIRYFAYPYGKLYEIGVKSIKCAYNSNYYYSFGTYNAPLTWFSMLFKHYLPRMTSL